MLLSRLVVSLIRVSGTTGVPEPPLRLDPDWLVGGLGVAALMLAALLVAEAASLAAFRGAPARTRVLEPRMTLARSTSARPSGSTGFGGATSVALQGLTLQVERGRDRRRARAERLGEDDAAAHGRGVRHALRRGGARARAWTSAALGPGAAARFRAREPRLARPALRAGALPRSHLRPHGRARARAARLAAARGAARSPPALLERVGLGDRLDARPGALSGGEQQRVALCAALAHRPRLLLADEPAGELDAENAKVVYGLIAELAREQGTTALVVSHDEAAATIADRLVYVRDGRVVEEGRPGRALRRWS